MGTEYAFDVLRAMYDKLRQPATNFTFPELHHRRGHPRARTARVTGVRCLNRRAASRAGRARRYVVAAPGRGGAAWLTEIAHGERASATHNNEVDIGVRVEVPNAVMDHLTKHLYEAKLVYYSDTFENKVRTFCMNPGGLVSEEHYERQASRWSTATAMPTRHGAPDNTNFAMLVSTQLHRAVQPAHRIRPATSPSWATCSPAAASWCSAWATCSRGRRTDVSRLKKSTTIPTLTHRRAGRPVLRAAAPPPDQHHRGHAAPSITWRPASIQQEHPALRRGGQVLFLQGDRGRPASKPP